MRSQSCIPDVKLPENKKLYFASDQHFGVPSGAKSKEREILFVSWLDLIAKDASAIFLLGDLFDFWFEYDTVVPKGFVRVLGKLAELLDRGISLYYFVGNHDLWMRGYFENEIGIPVFYKPQEFCCNTHRFLLGHGDGLGPNDKGYKRMKKVFTHPVSKWFFRWVHPDIGMQFAKYLSENNKLISGEADATFLGEEKEWLVQYCKRKLQSKHFDFFIFGHRHLPLEISLSPNSIYVNTGDWIQYFTYAVYDDAGLRLKKYPA